MKKKQLKKLKLSKNTISKINSQKVQGGGVSGHCNSSVTPDCNFACATAIAVCHTKDNC